MSGQTAVSCLTGSMVGKASNGELIYQMGYLVLILLSPPYIYCRSFTMPRGAKEVMLLDYCCILTAFRSVTYGEF